MDAFLQILGSVASIGSIPLTIYFYLRSRESKFTKLKFDIVKVLSYQIGEGRELALFEVGAVIDSKGTLTERNGGNGLMQSLIC